MSEQSKFVALVLGSLEQGDEGKVAKFQKKAVKYLTKQVALAQEKIEKLEEKNDEAGEEYAEAFVGVDVSKCSTGDAIEKYIPSYFKTLQSKDEEIAGNNEEIKALKEVIVLRKKQLNELA